MDESKRSAEKGKTWKTGVGREGSEELKTSAEESAMWEAEDQGMRRKGEGRQVQTVRRGI